MSDPKDLAQHERDQAAAERAKASELQAEVDKLNANAAEDEAAAVALDAIAPPPAAPAPAEPPPAAPPAVEPPPAPAPVDIPPPDSKPPSPPPPSGPTTGPVAPPVVVDPPAPAPAPPAPSPAPAPSDPSALQVYGVDVAGVVTGSPIVMANGDVFSLGIVTGAWGAERAILKNDAVLVADGGQEYTEGTLDEATLLIRDPASDALYGWAQWHGTYPTGVWTKFDPTQGRMLVSLLGDPRIPQHLVTNAAGQVFNDVSAAIAAGGGQLISDGGLVSAGGIECYGIPFSLATKDPINKPLRYVTPDYVGGGKGQCFIGAGLKDGGALYAGPGPLLVELDGVWLIGSAAPDVNQLHGGIWAEASDDNTPADEGVDLRYKRGKIENHYNGIITSEHMGPKSRVQLDDVWIEKCGFTDNSHGIYIDAVGELVATNVRFGPTVSVGHSDKSRARRTVLKNCSVLQRTSTASCIVDACDGGTVDLANCVFERSANTDQRANPIRHGEEGTARYWLSTNPTGYVDQFSMRDSLFVDWLSNRARGDLVDLALVRTFEAVNANPSLVPAGYAPTGGFPMPVPVMGPVVIAEMAFVGYDMDLTAAFVARVLLLPFDLAANTIPTPAMLPATIKVYQVADNTFYHCLSDADVWAVIEEYTDPTGQVNLRLKDGVPGLVPGTYGPTADAAPFLEFDDEGSTAAPPAAPAPAPASTGPISLDVSTWTKIGAENSVAALAKGSDVAYGATGLFFVLPFAAGASVPLNNATFGDPTPGVVKAGYVQDASVIAPPSSAPAPPAPAPVVQPPAPAAWVAPPVGNYTPVPLASRIPAYRAALKAWEAYKFPISFATLQPQTVAPGISGMGAIDINFWCGVALDQYRAFVTGYRMGGHHDQSGNPIIGMALLDDAPDWKLLHLASLDTDRTVDSDGYYADGAGASSHDYNYVQHMQGVRKVIRLNATAVWGDGNTGSNKLASMDDVAPFANDPEGTFPDMPSISDREAGVCVLNDDEVFVNAYGNGNSLNPLIFNATTETWYAFPWQNLQDGHCTYIRKDDQVLVWGQRDPAHSYIKGLYRVDIPLLRAGLNPIVDVQIPVDMPPWIVSNEPVTPWGGCDGIDYCDDLDLVAYARQEVPGTIWLADPVTHALVRTLQIPGMVDPAGEGGIKTKLRYVKALKMFWAAWGIENVGVVATEELPATLPDVVGGPESAFNQQP